MALPALPASSDRGTAAQAIKQQTRAWLGLQQTQGSKPGIPAGHTMPVPRLPMVRREVRAAVHHGQPQDRWAHHTTITGRWLVADPCRVPVVQLVGRWHIGWSWW
jgi:hypothetical protein